ncbi:DoxX family membrane protein [Vibrio sp. 03_296]|uniref:DoxX family membrane protein n=1 Tax=Vibrio sp. 03_296 TaxID=2024409 RepID=UPI001595D70F|nr:DoxX family membrane protein [Vibrio sp. 03_296]
MTRPYPLTILGGAWGITCFVVLWVAWWVFFNAGLSKIASWMSTLYLFEFEYQVPILPWEFAAYLATAAELSLPLLLALGVFTRITSLVLFAFNAMAVILLTAFCGREAFYDHQLWGLMLLYDVSWGCGANFARSLLSPRNRETLERKIPA